MNPGQANKMVNIMIEEERKVIIDQRLLHAKYTIK